MPRVFVLTNHKGGVGKSTSATNLAFGLVRSLRQLQVPNSRVLLIDTDSQGHATLVTTGKNDFGIQDSLYTPLLSDRQSATNAFAKSIVQSNWDVDLHVLPASASLEAAERELIGVPGAPFRLAEPLNSIAAHYAAIVIDTRPSFSLMTEMALLASTDAIIPVEPRYLETVGLLSVLNKINDIREGWRHSGLHVTGILITKMDSRIKGHTHLLEELKAHPILGKMLLGIIPANEAVSYAHLNHQSIFTYNSTAPASLAYAQLIGRIVRQICGGA